MYSDVSSFTCVIVGGFKVNDSVLQCLEKKKVECIGLIIIQCILGGGFTELRGARSHSEIRSWRE